MRLSASVCAIVLLSAAGGAAQTVPPPPAEQVAVWPPAVYLPDLACAPHVTFTKPTSRLHVTGSLDPERRLVFAKGQTLTLDGGAASGVEAGQQYFVRRLPKRFGAGDPAFDNPVSVHTLGWVRIRSADANIATAEILHSCDAIMAGDYLEPFAEPAQQTVLEGQFRYDNLGQVLGGDEDATAVGIGKYMVIDRGSDHGVKAGTRLVILRDKKEGPLIEMGEGIVLKVRPETSTVQVTRARGPIFTGDFVAIAK